MSDVKDVFAEFDEEEEEKPKVDEATTEAVKKSILASHPHLTREAVETLIDEERAKAGGLLTEEAAAHLVFSNLGTEEQPEPTPKEGRAGSASSPVTVKDPSGSEEAPASADEEDDSWFEAEESSEEEDLTTEEETTEPTEVPMEEEPEAAEETTEPDEKPAEEPTKDEDEDDWFEEGEPTEEAKPKEEKASEEEPAEEADEKWFEESDEQEKFIETPAIEGTLVPIGPTTIVVPAITPEDMRAQMKQFQRMKASLLDKNKDIATIQNKPFIKRSGWRKFALAFNISDEIIKEARDKHNGGFTWRIWVRAMAPNGRSAVGIGACSSEERNFAHVRHDVYATAHTRAKNRALSDLIGSGEVSWEELRGFDVQ